MKTESGADVTINKTCEKCGAVARVSQPSEESSGSAQQAQGSSPTTNITSLNYPSRQRAPSVPSSGTTNHKGKERERAGGACGGAQDVDVPFTSQPASGTPTPLNLKY